MATGKDWYSRMRGPEITLNTDTVVLANRRLRAVWSHEAIQDLRSVHNIEAERELTAVLATEIMREIDQEILHDLGLPIPDWVEPFDFSRVFGRYPEQEKVDWKRVGF